MRKIRISSLSGFIASMKYAPNEVSLTQRRARVPSTSEEGGSESDISIHLPVEDAGGVEDEKNQVDARLSTRPDTAVRSARPTQERQLSMRYR